MQLSLFIILEVLALVVSLIALPRYGTSFLKYFPVLLLLTLVVEVASQLLSSQWGIRSGWLYNILIGIQLLFYLLLFYRENRNPRFRRIASISIGLFLLFFFINILFGQGPQDFNYFTYLAGSFLVFFNACLLLIWLIQSAEEQPLLRQPLFWITGAALIFFTGTFFYFLFWYFLVIKQIDTNGALFLNLLYVLNIVYYGLLITGFLCPTRKK